jgi:hypothetical protein
MIKKSSINFDLSLYLLSYSRCSHIKHSYIQTHSSQIKLICYRAQTRTSKNNVSQIWLIECKRRKQRLHDVRWTNMLKDLWMSSHCTKKQQTFDFCVLDENQEKYWSLFCRLEIRHRCSHNDMITILRTKT